MNDSSKLAVVLAAALVTGVGGYYYVNRNTTPQARYAPPPPSLLAAPDEAGGTRNEYGGGEPAPGLASDASAQEAPVAPGRTSTETFTPAPARTGLPAAAVALAAPMGEPSPGAANRGSAAAPQAAVGPDTPPSPAPSSTAAAGRADASSRSPGATTAPDSGTGHVRSETTTRPASNAFETTRPASPPPAPPTSTYVIKSGDSFGSIAQRILGSESRWRDIAQANPLIDPNRLKVGMTIRLPDPASLRSAEKSGPGGADASRPGRDAGNAATRAGDAPAGEGNIVYIVKPGDTLSSIARQYYHDRAHAKIILRANEKTLKGAAANIRPGMKLILPPTPHRAR